MVELSRSDPRDVGMLIAMIRHAGASLHDGDRALALAEELAELPVAAMISEVRGRWFQPSLRDSCGLEIVNTPTGPGFAQRGFESLKPGGDLVALGLRLLAIVEADAYGDVGLELATELPAVWFRPVPAKDVAAALRRRRAGMTIRAELRPSDPDAHVDHHLWIFVQELSTANDAASLAALSRLAQREDTQVLGVSAGSLFALVVAASTRQGVRAHERNGALERFAAPVRQALESYHTAS
jgi:hypothetical protein